MLRGAAPSPFSVHVLPSPVARASQEKTSPPHRPPDAGAPDPAADAPARSAEAREAQEAGFFQRLTAFETALIAAGVVVFLVLMYEMREVLTPPLLAAAGLCMLWPLRSYAAVRAILTAGGLLLGVWFLDKLSIVLLPFVVTYLLAYLFDPAVGYLKSHYRIPRWASSLGVTALVVGAVSLVILLLVPTIVGELETLGRRIVRSVGDLRLWIETSPLIDRLEEANMVNREDLIQELTSIIQAQAAWLTNRIPAAAQGFLRQLGSILGVVTTVAVTPVLLFYILKDYPIIKRSVVGLFPTFGGRRDYLVQTGSIAGRYLRGQLLIGAIAFANVSILLTLFNIPFALLIGVLAGLLNLIPTLGAILTFIVGIFLTLIFGDPWLAQTIVVVVVLLGQNLLEQSILTPNILGHQVGLHPVLILLSLFVFGFFLGIFGLLIAVPTTALLVTYYKAYRKELQLDLSNGAA